MSEATENMILAAENGIEPIDVSDAALFCPFCLKNEYFEAATLTTCAEDGPLWQVFCHCGATGPYVTGGAAAAVAAWNQRHVCVPSGTSM